MTISHTTIIDPTGVENSIDMSIPASAHTTEITAEHMTTLLKMTP